MKTSRIIIFDAECSFCNASVNFIIKRDPNSLFCLPSMHSRTAQSLMLEQGRNELDSDTIILIKEGKAYLRAEAVYEILNELKSFWSFLRIFRSLGRSLNDTVYRYIAKNRYKFFSKNSCAVPSEELRSRFLTDTA